MIDYVVRSTFYHGAQRPQRSGKLFDMQGRGKA